MPPQYTHTPLIDAYLCITGLKPWWQKLPQVYRQILEVRKLKLEIKKDSQVPYFWSTFICTFLFSIQLHVLKSSLALLSSIKNILLLLHSGFPGGSEGLSTMRETWVRFPGWKDPLGKEMATHSGTLAWKIWTEEPGRL